MEKTMNTNKKRYMITDHAKIDRIVRLILDTNITFAKVGDAPCYNPKLDIKTLMGVYGGLDEEDVSDITFARFIAFFGEKAVTGKLRGDIYTIVCDAVLGIFKARKSTLQFELFNYISWKALCDYFLEKAPGHAMEKLVGDIDYFLCASMRKGIQNTENMGDVMSGVRRIFDIPWNHIDTLRSYKDRMDAAYSVVAKLFIAGFYMAEAEKWKSCVKITHERRGY